MFGFVSRAELKDNEAAYYEQRLKEVNEKNRVLNQKLSDSQRECSQLAEKLIELERRNDNLFAALTNMVVCLRDGRDIELNIV